MNDSNNYFKELIEKIPITEVFIRLGYRISSAGNTDKVLCPFHNDTNPSLVLYSDHYHCYACGAHGNIFEIVKHIKNFSFYDALNWIEEEFPQYKREFSQKSRTNREIEEKGFDIAYKTYKKMNINEKKGLLNFAKERVFDFDFLHGAEVYYSIKNKLCNEHQEDIRKINLLLDDYLLKRKAKTIENDKAEYVDIFNKDRVVLTLRDLKGEIVGFVGRAVTSEDKPKYLFTKNLEKSRMLYRLNYVKKNNIAIKEENENKKFVELYIVEGAFDALRLESLGYNAAAVLGSHITKSQVEVLVDYIKEVSKGKEGVRLHLFLDSDKAGLKGVYQSIRNLWQNEFTRSIYIDIILNQAALLRIDDEGQGDPLVNSKDPDEILRYIGRQEADLYLQKNTISAFEFLLRYFSDVEELNFENAIFETYYAAKLDLNQKISLCNKVVSMIPNQNWKQIVAFYSSFLIDNEDFSFKIIKNFIDGVVLTENKGTERIVRQNRKSVNQLINHALQIAKKSYESDDLPIDSFTWDRIQLCADAFYPFFHEVLRRNETVKAPMLAINTPKKNDEYRLRTLFNHEQLILQQYFLNELLKSDENRDFERFIPAIRYNPNLKNSIYTTGLDYYNHFEETKEKTVSFAYQINMTAINGETLGGMFRPYYESWRSFIEYLEEGIKKLDSDKVFKVRLDIKKFYDDLPMRAIRRVLIEPLKNALRLGERFTGIFNYESNDDKAKEICDWLLGEIFHYEYIDPATGETKRYKSALKGIPQGPNLSAYLANIALFPLDKAVSTYVNKVNAKYQDKEGKIAVRYARYVDDMVIISTNSEYLKDLKDIIIDELAKVDLTLSNKTEDAEMVEKQEASDWLIDERGGLGVSGIFDSPEEPTEDIISEYQRFEMIDRREALKVLQNVIYDFEFIPKCDIENFIEIFFRTSEVRYTDIKRFAIFLLRHIRRQNEPMIIDCYKEILEKNRHNTPVDSMFRRKEVEYLSLVDAILDILSDDISLKLSSQERKERSDDKKAIMDLVMKEDFLQTIVEISSADELKENRYILKLKWLSIFNQVLKNILLDTDNTYYVPKEAFANTIIIFFESNIQWDKMSIYEKRLLFSIYKEASCCGIESNRFVFYAPTKDTSSLNLFHLVTSYIIAIKRDKNKFNEIGSLLSEYQFKNEDIFKNCIYLWFKEDEYNIDIANEYLESAVSVLVNIIDNSIIAEIIEKNDILKACLIKEEKGNVLNYIPVPPGVDYLGIFALNQTGRLVKRVDFSRDDHNYIADLNWVTTDNILDRNWKIYQASTTGQWVSINDYFYNQDKEIKGELLKEIVRIYRQLINILKVEEMQPIISKYHIFITEEKEIKILSYNLDYSKINSSVAISNGNHSLKVVDVPQVGKIYWQIAYVLENALGIERYINTTEPNTETDQIHKILSYAFRRLKGDWMNRSSVINNIKSYEKTVNRTLESLEKYAEAKNKQLYTLDCIVINHLIGYRMNVSIEYPGLIEYSLAIWSKSFLNNETYELQKIFEVNIKDVDKGTVLGLENAPLRRVPLSYFLIAHRLSGMIQDNGNLIGLKALSGGLFVHSISVNLKMQFLERIIALKKAEYINLLEGEFPIEFLEVDINNTCFVKVDEDQIQELKSIVKNLCQRNHDDRIKKITPVGWLLLLCWILEIDNQMNYVTFLRRERNNTNNDVMKGLKSGLIELASKLTLMDGVEEQKNSAFPFDNINKFINTWNEDEVSHTYKLLNQIDNLDNIKVNKRSSKYFYYKLLDKNTIEINLHDKGFHSIPSFFLTDGIVGNCGKRKEVDSLTDKSVWSETTINNEIVGVSAVSDKLMLLSGIAGYENIREFHRKGHDKTGGVIEYFYNESNEAKKDTQTKNIDEEKQEIVKNNDKKDNSPPSCLLEEEKLKGETEHKDTKATSKNFGVTNRSYAFEDVIKEFNKYQNDNWVQRGKHFSTYDRIAFFQFNVDNSYEHPIVELCIAESAIKEGAMQFKKTKSAWDPHKLKEEGKLDEKAFIFSSCAEFRRRKLLDKVLKVCKDFGVEILLLPEYSVRPETVEWLTEEIVMQGYKISVWAGTLRLVPNRKLNHDVFEEKLATKEHDWAALLPIVTFNTHKFYCNFNLNPHAREIQPRVIVDRIKKYPALSLQEVINPVMAKDTPLDAVIKKKFEERLFGDARDDVFELICAELFMIASPSNSRALAKASFDLYKRFKTGALLKYDEYYKLALKDIEEFGKRTAIHQTEYKFGRTPILLVPAYTTRATDYYVTAQAGYLASGLTTVFCNAVGIKTAGGSCFIGTESWDDYNGSKNDTLPDYSPYQGVTPGIYQQFLQHKDRGALGKNEQALVICDINPNISFKGKPNPQTLGPTLELVAHLPIIESHELDIKKKVDLKNDHKYYCRCQTHKRKQIKYKHCLQCQESSICHQCDNVLKSLIELYSYLNAKEENDYRTTADEEKPNIIGNALKSIGREIESDWLIRRGDAYTRQHINNPQDWPPPTALDWIWVDVDYENEYKANMTKIDIPKFASVEMKKIE